VDLMHYNCQSEEDLKRIYDRVMSQGGEVIQDMTRESRNGYGI
jgi:hypothetical protein